MAGRKTHATRGDPERTGPNRTSGGSSSGGAATTPPGGVIDRAVRLAYGVVDDHIVQGRRAAEALRQGTYSSKDFDDDLRACLDRALRMSKEWGVWGVDFFDVIRRRAGAQTGSGPSAPDVALEVNSKRRAEVKFHLRPGMSRFNPSVPAIHSADKNKPPIEDAHFEFRDNSRPVLVVNIPDGHPQGVYHGAIVDSKTREPGGFISVRVFEEDKH
jgi:hypothetical protein